HPVDLALLLLLLNDDRLAAPEGEQRIDHQREPVGHQQRVAVARQLAQLLEEQDPGGLHSGATRSTACRKASVRLVEPRRSISSRAVPWSTIRPAWISAIRSQRYSASLITCVEKITQVPRERA